MTAVRAVDHVDNSKKRILVRRIARSDDDEGWLQRWMQDHATQQPTQYFSLHREDASN